MDVIYRAKQKFSHRGRRWEKHEIVDDPRAFSWSLHDLCYRARRLEKLSRKELYELAKAAGIPGRTQMKRDELVAALKPAIGDRQEREERER